MCQSKTCLRDWVSIYPPLNAGVVVGAGGVKAAKQGQHDQSNYRQIQSRFHSFSIQIYVHFVRPPLFAQPNGAGCLELPDVEQRDQVSQSVRLSWGN